jgi:hypothetical protein
MKGGPVPFGPKENTSMRAPFILCFALAALAGCGTSREERAAGPAGASPESDAPDHTIMWAEPAGLFLAGLEGGQPILTRAQFLGAIDGQWAAADSDRDGSLRSFELQAWRVTWFGSDDGWPGLFHFDANSDGAIGKQEFKAGLEAIFTTFDKNKDGVIDRAELLVEKRPPEMRFGPRSGPSTPPAQTEGGEGRPSEKRREEAPASP